MYFDSHCHLDFAVFDHDRLLLLQQCQEQKIERILIPGTCATSWPKQIALCQSHAELDLALGIHPWFLNDVESEHVQHLYQLSQQHQLLAIGEIGLDFIIDIEPQQQVRLLRQQLEIASQLKLPVILHQRKAHNELVRQLKLSGFDGSGVVHAFSGSQQQAEDYLNLGLKIGVGGTVTYQRANKTRTAIQSLALEHFLLETDAPDMPLFGQQGRRNTPLNIPLIACELANIKGVEIDKIADVCAANYRQLFQV